MGKKHDGKKASGAGSVVVCHGCCCARDSKGRRDQQAVRTMEDLRKTIRPLGADVVVVDCLGPCKQRDVVVVRPSKQGRAEGGRPVWLREVTPHTFTAVVEWLRDGGPGVAHAPEALDEHEFRPERKHREQKNVK